MNYSSLSVLEKNIAGNGNNGEYVLRKFSLPVPGENITLNGMLATPQNRSKYYYDVAHPKERIVIHFTAGNIRSDLGALTRDEYHVSVPFLIGRSGVVYQLFPSKFWSGHIGKGVGNMNTGNAQDKVTIGIELSNYGYLTEKDGNLETYYSRQKDDAGKTGPVDVYCSLADKEAYTKTASPFRNQSYYATFTDAQYDSLIVLLRYLTATFKIPRQFMPEPERYVTTDEVLKFKGIVSHINYRQDGKWDFGPGFDWKKLIDGVQAASYTPLPAGTQQAEKPLSKSLESTSSFISSEAQMEGLVPEAKDASAENEPYEDAPERKKD